MKKVLILLLVLLLSIDIIKSSDSAEEKSKKIKDQIWILGEKTALEKVKEAINEGADIDQRSDNGNPLTSAANDYVEWEDTLSQKARVRYLDIIDTLLKAGSNTNIPDRTGKSFIDYVKENPNIAKVYNYHVAWVRKELQAGNQVNIPKDDRQLQSIYRQYLNRVRREIDEGKETKDVPAEIIDLIAKYHIR